MSATLQERWCFFNCKLGHHAECEGERIEWLKHGGQLQHLCTCACHGRQLEEGNSYIQTPTNKGGAL